MQINKQLQNAIRNKQLLQDMLMLQNKIHDAIDYYVNQPQDTKYSIEDIYGILVGVSEDLGKINNILCDKIKQELDNVQINV
tara:strand:+ start:1018 stop:1263 length:246 start_codon:yes stop_codon:yes gene_type:complete